MATGIQSTAQSFKEAGTADVLRSGEKASMLITGSNPAAVKTFYHQIPGARFIMPDGLELQFMGGQFSTDDKSIIAELNKIADRGTSMVYTKKPGALAAVVAQNAQAATGAITDTAAVTAQS